MCNNHAQRMNFDSCCVFFCRISPNHLFGQLMRNPPSGGTRMGNGSHWPVGIDQHRPVGWLVGWLDSTVEGILVQLEFLRTFSFLWSKLGKIQKRCQGEMTFVTGLNLFKTALGIYALMSSSPMKEWCHLMTSNNDFNSLIRLHGADVSLFAPGFYEARIAANH